VEGELELRTCCHWPYKLLATKLSISLCAMTASRLQRLSPLRCCLRRAGWLCRPAGPGEERAGLAMQHTDRARLLVPRSQAMRRRPSSATSLVRTAWGTRGMSRDEHLRRVEHTQKARQIMLLSWVGGRAPPSSTLSPPSPLTCRHHAHQQWCRVALYYLRIAVLGIHVA